MPTSMLDGGAAAALPRRPLQIRVRTQPEADFEIVVRTATDGGTAVRRPRPGLVVLPAIGEPAVIAVRSTDGRPFPPTTTVSVDVTAGAAASADPERAVLAAVRLGGLIERELVAVAGDGARLIVSAAAGSAVDVALDPLGDAARASASTILGASAVREEEALNVVLAVDSSASFRASATDGSLLAVAAVLAGIASTLVRDLRTGAAVVGDDVRWLDVPALGQLAPTIVEAVGRTTAGSAFRSAAPPLREFDPERNTQVYLLTDAVPGDLAALEAEERQEGQGRHLVLLGRPSALRAGRTTDLPTTVVDPVPDLAALLLADRAALAALVGRLLVGCFAPGSPSAERVPR